MVSITISIIIKHDCYENIVEVLMIEVRFLPNLHLEQLIQKMPEYERGEFTKKIMGYF